MNKFKIPFIVMLSICITNVFCGITEDVQSKINQIDQKIATIDTTVNNIKGAHNQLKTQLVDTLSSKINNELNPAIKQVQNSKKDLDDIPGGFLVDAALTVLNIGDLKSTLMSIYNALYTTKHTLNGIKMAFQEYVDDLNPQTDPKGIYSKFASSRKNLIKTKNSLQEMLPLLRLLE